MEVECCKCNVKIFVRDAWHGVHLWQTENLQIDSETLKVTCSKCADASNSDENS